MPICSYQCKNCGERFDLLVGVGVGEEEPKCERCGSRDLERLLTTFGVKGGGPGEASCAAPT